MQTLTSLNFYTFSENATIEYFPITQTLTKIRVKNHNHMPTPQTEIFCYPITNISRPLDLFGPFPKTSHSFVPVNPPPPPNRKSSKRSTAMKIFSEIKSEQISKASSKDANSKAVAVPKRPIPETCRSKSTGSLLSTYSVSVKEEKNYTNHSRVARKQLHHRVSSVSPVGRITKPEQRKSSASPIAFGRSISKERTFAEEKKKLEQQHPLCRRTFTASSSILRNPDLKSPDEVKRAIRTSFIIPSKFDNLMVSKSSRKETSNGLMKSSVVNYSVNKFEKGSLKNDEKTLRLSLSMSSRASPTGTVSSRTTGRSITPVSLKTNVTRASRSTEPKYRKSDIQRIRNSKLNGSSSNISLARTSSTYSIDSVSNSKKKSVERPFTMSRSTSRDIYYPVSITGKKRQKRSISKENLTVSKQTTLTRKGKTTTDQTDEKFMVQKFHDSINEEILNNKQYGKTRSDTFFQNLFFGDEVQSPTPTPSIVRTNSVQEKARAWNVISTKADPSTKHLSVYLRQKRAVTDSKFKANENERLRQSRSLSPQRVGRSDCVYYNNVSKYNSFVQLSDDEEFGKVTESYKYEERSRSAPASKIWFTEVVRPNSPVVIHGKLSPKCVTPNKNIRSPSCRRIQGLRATHNAELNRTRSLEPTDRFQCLDSQVLSRSSCSIDINSYENHAPVCPHTKSDRFKDLEKFYCNLERVGQLEKATSSTDLRPIRKDGEIIDFDLWKKIRSHEKAEKELDILVGKIKRDEKDKDFLFRPKYYEDYKWDERKDSGLRIKEKSVEDLKEILLDKSMQDDMDSLKHQEVETAKGKYKSLWRANSVLDAATNMTAKYNRSEKSNTLPTKKGQDHRFGLSRKLISTLSRDQISKVKNQLSEIYSNNFGPLGDKNARESDKYVVDVLKDSKGQQSGLTVRSNSLVFKEDLLEPVMRRQENRLMSSYKAESIGSIREPRVSRSVDRYENIIKNEQQVLSDSEKRNILHNLSKEIQDKLNERRQKSIIMGKETRGAIANSNARNTLTKSPRKLSLQHSTMQMSSDNKQDNIEPKVNRQAQCSKVDSTNPQHSMMFIEKQSSTLHQDDIEDTANTPKQNVKDIPTTEKIVNKIHYFEQKKVETPNTTIYHAREYSSPDEEEVMKVIEDKINLRKATEKGYAQPSSTYGHSTSASDFKELFGETSHEARYTPSPSAFVQRQTIIVSPMMSHSTSATSVFRSRSVSPLQESRKPKFYFSSTNKAGDVKKIKDKFESLTYSSFASEAENCSPRRFQSDPELNKSKRLSSPSKNTIKHHEVGDVSWITHKFETKNSVARSRNRTRKVISPIPKVSFKANDRFMPHIDIISKTAALKKEVKPPTASNPPTNIWTGDVKKIKDKFEMSPDRLSLLGQLYTSSPDISELKDISSYLSGSWVAHKYPKTKDNGRSSDRPDQSSVSNQIRKRRLVRPSSASPPRNATGSTMLLKHFYTNYHHDDSDVVKPKPIGPTSDKRIEADQIWRKLQNKMHRKPVVQFEGSSKIFQIST